MNVREVPQPAVPAPVTSTGKGGGRFGIDPYLEAHWRHRQDYPQLDFPVGRFAAKLNDEIFDWMTIDAQRREVLIEPRETVACAGDIAQREPRQHRVKRRAETEATGTAPRGRARTRTSGRLAYAANFSASWRPAPWRPSSSLAPPMHSAVPTA